MSRRSAQERRPDRPQQHPVARTPAPAADDEVLRALATSLRDTQTGPTAGAPPATPPAALRALAGRLGNRQMAQLHRAMAPAQAPQSQPAAQDRADAVANREPVVARAALDADTIRRDDTPAVVTVALSYNAGSISHYAVSGDTMEAATDACHNPAGEFDFNPHWNVSNPSGENKTVTITVNHHIVMPRWTQVGAQPQRIQDAWNRLYGDLLTHEREHETRCHAHFDALRGELSGLDGAAYTAQELWDIVQSSVTDHNNMHINHTGFVTPAYLDLNQYIPEDE